jgi:hypothetical protein
MTSLPKILKPFIVLLFSCFLFLLFSSPVLAQKGANERIGSKVEKDLKATGENVAKWTIGDSVVGGEEAGMFGLLTHAVIFYTAGTESQPGGAIGGVNSLISYMITNPPARTSEYLADLGSNLGLVRPAYAQGTGWQALKPVLPVWKAFRNVAYMAFVIIFIAIGFMVMFRAKVNPQTVITVQSALPKLIITLLLITFSYAIAGLMIDLIYIAIYILVGVLSLGRLINNSGDVINFLLTKNPFSLVYMKGVEDLFTSGPADALQAIIEGLFGYWTDPEKGTVLGQPIGALAKCVLAVAILFQLVKLFFALLLSYLGIVLSVIFAPFTILFNALPGSTSFMNWLKGLLANIAPFPAVAGMFLLAAILIGPKGENNPWGVSGDVGFYSQKVQEEGVWVPPMLMGEEGKGLGSVNAFQGLIALGMIMMTPKVVEMIKKALKVEEGAMAAGIPTIISGLAAPIRTIQAYKGWQQERESKEYQRLMLEQARATKGKP